MTMPSRKKRRSQKGQVLLLAVLAIIILAVAVMVLFDLQRIMRGKIKVMSGIDAAALTGANWQKHTLNLQGELNLVKACHVLISDSIYGIGGNPDGFMKVSISENSTETEIADAIKKARQELSQLKTAADMLTEMQVRVGFVGPLIGFGAAQQAAKNNGLPANAACNQYMIDFYNLILDNDIYGNPELAPQVYYGYAWREPYANMIFNLVGSVNLKNAAGIAVGTSVLHLGMPRLYSDPPTNPNFIGFLQLKIVMDAIAANDWCLLQNLLEADDSAFLGKWWGNIKVDPNRKFEGGSEILPIHTDHSTGQQIFDFADAAGYLADAVNRKTGREDLLVRLNEFYNDADPVDASGILNREDADMKFNPLPSITWSVFGSRWRSYKSAGVDLDAWKQYLRSGFRTGYDYYSGAVSYFSVSVPNKVLTRKYDLPSGLRRSGGNTGNSDWKKMQDYSSKASQSQHLMTSHGIRFNAAAKPFGVLKAEDGTLHHPFAAAMVLPVFDKTALIPVALEKPDGLEMEDRAWILYLTKFLPALGQVNSLDEVEGAMSREHYETVRQAGYVDLLRKLMDPAWRAEGRAWLNAEATGHDVYDTLGNKTGHVVDTVNRDHCLDWKSGGGSGYRTGPGEIH